MSNNHSTSKKLDTLVEDIYKSLEPLNNRQSLELSDENIDKTVTLGKTLRSQQGV